MITYRQVEAIVHAVDAIIEAAHKVRDVQDIQGDMDLNGHARRIDVSLMEIADRLSTYAGPRQ